MREILLVGISALLGYIVFSAFSSTSTSEEALKKILQQPHNDMQLQQELAFNRLANDKETKLIALENQNKKDQLEVYQKIKINEKENNTKVELKEIDFRMNSALANMKLQSEVVQKKQDNYTLIIIAFFIFILFFIYLRYQKYLAQMELENETEYRKMLTQKEYAEKILTLLASGNLTFETERKLLKVLDELNGKKREENREIIYHPNPEIAQFKIQE